MTVPCCCSLQTGARILAISHFTLAIIAIGFGTIGILVLFDDSHKEKVGDPHKNPAGFFFSLWIAAAIFVLLVIIVIFGIVSIILSTILLVGVYKRSWRTCIAWMISYSIASLVYHGCAIILLRDLEIVLKFMLPQVPFGIYCLWVVWAFIQELRDESVNTAPNENGMTDLQVKYTNQEDPKLNHTA